MIGWLHEHREPVGASRMLLLKLRGPWIVDAEERFPALDNMSVRIQIGDFEELGRGLCIDGVLQLAEGIDSSYTTSLVFPAAILAASRRRWLVIGGGDGATPREALRFRDTKSVRLIDISRLVIDWTQEFIPSFWAGCQKDPRLEITIRDAREVLEEMVMRGEQADVVVYDLSDPREIGGDGGLEAPANHLYTEEAFRLAGRCVAEGGIFVAQMGELSPLCFEAHLQRRQSLGRVFRHVYSYRTFIEPFGCAESFVVASNHDGPWSPVDAVRVDERLARFYGGDWAQVYSAQWHAHLFALPPILVRRMEAL